MQVNGIFSSIILGIAFAFIPAAVAVFIVKEKEIKAKHLQQISGVGIISYWTSNLLFDFTMYMVGRRSLCEGRYETLTYSCARQLSALMSGIIILLYNNAPLTGSNFGPVLLVMMMFGLAIIPFTYLMGFLFKSHSTAQNVMILVYMVRHGV